MKRCSILIFVGIFLLLSLGSAWAQDDSGRRGIFAVFLCSSGPIDTALSISNVQAGPMGIGNVMNERSRQSEGTIEFYFWNRDGVLTSYETGPGAPGSGLSQSGTLGMGKTYTVLLSELLDASGYVNDSFTGYGWVVANFTGVQGTANVTDFARFTQTTVLQPDLGTPFFDRDANAGVPIVVPE